VSNTAPFVRPAENQLHYYDFYNRQLGLNLVEFTPKYSGDQVSFFADLDFGQMADWNAAYTTAPLVIDEVSKHIGQAVISYAPNAAPGLIIEFGKLYSHVGLEVIKSKDNWNYSRSVTFGYGSPFWHTGIHVGYALVPSRLTANVYLYNGVNNLNATTKVPTLGAQLKYTPSDTTTLIYNYLGGPQQPGNVSNMRQYHEANATFNLASNLSLGLEFLAGSEQNVASVSKATWTGFTAAAKWQYSEKSYLSPRYEIFKDNHGYMTGAKRTINTYTLTHSTKLTDIMEARLEGRWDHTNDTGLLFKSSGAGTNDQVSALVGVMVTMQ
jgi:catechol 2,3-dioxygenase-like lactoylglutathione lyase family enzyme